MAAESSINPNERYCTSCGSVVKEQAEICTDCGVRNDIQAGRNSPGKFYCHACGEHLNSEARRCPNCGVSHDPSSSSSSSSSGWSSGLSNADAILWGLGIISVLIGLGGLSNGVTPGTLVVAAVFIVGGLVLLPPVRETLSKEHPILTFGTVRDVDSQPVDSHTERCLSCDSPVDNGGVARRYYEDLVVFGLTVRRTEGGTNVYCSVCSRDGFDRDTTAERSPTLETE